LLAKYAAEPEPEPKYMKYRLVRILGNWEIWESDAWLFWVNDGNFYGSNMGSNGWIKFITPWQDPAVLYTRDRISDDASLSLTAFVEWYKKRGE
jgi:hypothetical protein